VIETGWRQRTALAQQRSQLALVLIGALLLTHAHMLLGVAAALAVAAAGLAARTPEALTRATVLTAIVAALLVIA
jgi:hypothetical protein